VSHAYGIAPGFVASEPRGACAALLEYWLACRHGRDVPARADIDPLSIPRLLPHIAIYELEGEPVRFRYRLVGTAIVTADGRELTGAYADEMLSPEIREQALQFYREAAATRRGACHDAQYTDHEGRRRHYQRIILPLADPGQPVNKLLIGTVTEAA